VDEVAAMPATPRQAGDVWLASAHAPLLRVPSVLVPQAWNVIVNPAHPAAAHIRIAEIIPYASMAGFGREPRISHPLFPPP
jgi:RES domain-containing protein